MTLPRAIYVLALWKFQFSYARPGRATCTFVQVKAGQMR